MKSTRTFITCFGLCSMLLLAFSNIFNRQPSDLDPPPKVTTTTDSKDPENPRDKLQEGLLATEFDESSCLSRYQSSMYRKPSPYKPSQYLISKLRTYERLHKHCGPDTEAYKRSKEQLDQHVTLSGSSGELCQYIVWVPLSGLGNRILSLVSVFLYALLTERVILVDQRNDIRDLFCEPFPATSWLLPLDFPLTDQFDSFNWRTPISYGNMLKRHVINSSTETFPSYLYLHLVHNYGDYDQMFFCQGDQSLIKKVPWLIVKSDNYFIPSLWLIPSFQPELSKLFPQKDTVFHHLARYLIHPTNQVWGLVSRFYDAYLSRADETLGIQVRVFHRAGFHQLVMDQIVSCTQRENLLPEAAASQEEDSQQVTNISRIQKLKAVLVTSLNPEYSNSLKRLYWEGLSFTGDIVGVYQPSQEMYQQRNKKLHNQKALAEMYLLSLTDNIVTSAWSTFGYVAQGLGGMKPWILYKVENYKAPDQPCVRATSMEPCFHSPPFNGCEADTGTDAWKTVPYVRPCEDRISGLKLFDHPEEL
ncbi:hypothetical protein EUTSA_v10009872mg [Eutrema salsugineum]|uniref:Fucosyltransferase n=2 Tax=Eutrema salsugineum TaxID=72664 RepID=V4KVM0_EUTSA|nr:hypothetical protein EUTSA_v10009872mg [Eutrema salsugineum]